MDDVTSIVTYLDDLLSVKELHEKIKLESEPRSPSSGQQFPFDIVQTSRATLPKKESHPLHFAKIKILCLIVPVKMIFS